MPLLLKTADEKNAAVLEFLLDENAQCMIIVGLGGSGKTTAVHAALAALPEDSDVTVFVWNNSELPGMIRRGCTDNGTGLTKWIVCRWSEDDVLTRGLIDEWSVSGPAPEDPCSVIFFA